MHLEFDLTIKRIGKEKMMYDLGAILLAVEYVIDRQHTRTGKYDFANDKTCVHYFVHNLLFGMFNANASGLFPFDQFQENEIAIESEFQRFRINRIRIEFHCTHSDL